MLQNPYKKTDDVKSSDVHSGLLKFCQWYTKQSLTGNAQDLGRREQLFGTTNLVVITNTTVLHSQLCLFAVFHTRF